MMHPCGTAPYSVLSMLFTKGTAPFPITMYPLNYGKISVVYKGYILLSCTPFYCHVPLELC